jgi:hypothetical protein
MTAERPTTVPYWKIILAAVLDFITVAWVFGLLIANLTGQTTAKGFSLEGGPALLWFGLMIAYFVLGPRFGGTLWRRILRVPPQPRDGAAP